MADWLEYMTGEGRSTLANERRRNGRDKPWKVKYFGIGNETWGCGGNMRPEYPGRPPQRLRDLPKAPTAPKRVRLAATATASDHLIEDADAAIAGRTWMR